MGRLFIILVLIGSFIVWIRWRKLKAKQEKREFIYKGIVLGLVLVIIGLAVFGRIDALGAVFAALLLCMKFIIAFAIRNFPFIAKIYGVTDGFGTSKKRQLKSLWLEISIDFPKGDISGKVIRGQFEGQELNSLNFEQLKSLLEECKSDSKSTYFLKAYIARRFHKKRDTHDKNHQQQESKSTLAESLSRDEALEILGLEGNPQANEIKLAHKKLMQKVHPDRGGNDFLASLLNRARDRLSE